VSPATGLVASPSSIAPGQTSQLSWTTPDGTFLAAVVDRGLGEKGASGSSSVTPAATMTWRRLAFTAEGGALAEESVSVGGSDPEGDPIFEDGFDLGTGSWDSVVG
jgi:hypothetical protein